MSENIPVEFRRVLFWFVAVPGAKPITFLREALEAPQLTPQEANAAVHELCNRHSEYLRITRQDVYGLARRTYVLNQTLGTADLRALAMEASKSGWWPDRARIRAICDSSWVRSMRKEDKNFYEDQENVVFAVSEGMRRLLTGLGELPDETNENASLSLIAHFLTVLAPHENPLDVADVDHLPISFAVRLLDAAFAKGRDIRAALEILVGRCMKDSSGLSMRDALEIASLCVWTGQTALVDKLASLDWADGAAICFLYACVKLDDDTAAEELLAAVRRLGEGERKYRQFENCLAWRLLSAAIAVRCCAGRSEVAKIALGGRTEFYYGALARCAFPLARELGWGLARCVDVFEGLNFISRYNFGYEYGGRFRSLDGSDEERRSFPRVLGFFVFYEMLKNEEMKFGRDELFPLVRAFGSVEDVLNAGYPTLAGVFVSTTTGLVDAQQSRAMSERVKAEGGLWVLPYKPPESNWEKVLKELGAALPRSEKRKNKAKASKPPKGHLVWGLRLRPIDDHDSAPNLYRIQALDVGFVEDNRASCRELTLREASSPKYESCRTREDAALICIAAGCHAVSMNASERQEAMKLLLAHPHLAVSTVLRNGYYGRYTDFVPMTLVRGELSVTVEKQSDGWLSLSVPKWCGSGSFSYCLRKEGDARYVYYEISTDQKRLLEVFGRRGTNGKIAMPSQAEAAVRQFVTNAMRVTPVGGGFGGLVLASDANLRRVEGIAQPVVRLEFTGEVLSIGCGVVPYEGAEFTPPVQTTQESLAHVDGEAVVLVRDANSEKSAFEPVLEVFEKHHVAGDVVTGRYQANTLEDSLSVLMALKELGDAVHLEWPRGAKIEISEMDEFSGSFSDLKTERNWFAVRGTFKLDTGRVMDIVKMLKALDGQDGAFVRLSDGEFVRLSDALRRRLEALKAAGTLRKDSVEVSSAAVPMLSREFGDGEGLPEQLRASAKRLAAEFARVRKVPASLKATLRPYQRDGFAWLSRHAACGFGACLADDMGLGKTLQLIALLLERADEGPSLVVAPASVCGNWKNEIARFAPTLRVFLGWEFDHDEENPFAGLKAGDVVVTSYGMLVSRTRAFDARTWNGVVLDEAQAIKNDVSKRAHAVKNLKSAFRMVATGTPVENKLAELWSLFDFLNPGLLGPGTTFAQRLTDLNGMATEGLKRLVAPFILRRLKTAVLKDLPPKTEITLPIELGPEERTAYEACRLHALESLKGCEGDRISILAELTRIRRFCCHPSLVLPKFKESAKLDALQELLSDLKSAGHRALVFSQFTDYLAIVSKLLKKNGWTYQYLDGTTPIAERGRAVDAFQAGEGDFFLISLKAGGTGLNLTAANYVVLLDPWWNPAVENQAADRVHRIGQKNPVTVYRLIASKTVEERVLELHQEKLRIADDVLSGTSRSKLTPEMLMRLFE